MGYRTVFVMVQGIAGWEQEGLPVETAEAPLETAPAGMASITIPIDRS